MGRPSLLPDQRKNYLRSVYFYREEYYRVNREAIRADMHVSEYIRRAVIEKMEREAPDALPVL